jgi:hypothetical protein
LLVVRSEDLQRGAATERLALRRTLFARTEAEDDELVTLRNRLDRAERNLASVVAAAGMDDAAVRAVTSHVRLICRPGGYAIVESDYPPLALDDEEEIDGDLFVVERLTPSPFPADARRCVILVPLGAGRSRARRLTGPVLARPSG